MKAEKRFAAVIPAAGLSSRMGAFKPLLPFGDGTVIEASVKNALTCAATAAVVLGKRSEELGELLKSRFGERLVIVENTDYASTDMLASVKLGISAAKDYTAFFVAPADMPSLPPSVYKALAEAFDAERGEVLLPVINGRRGHPPLISAGLIPAILSYDGADGLRGFYRRCTVREIPMDDTGIFTDIDTPEDYRSALNSEALHSGPGTPSVNNNQPESHKIPTKKEGV